MANLALLALAAALVPGAIDRLAVSGGLASHARSDPSVLIVAAEGRPALGDAVTREALVVIRSRLDADPRVAEVDAVDVKRGSDVSVLEVELAEASSADRQEAAEEITAGIDPGPLEVAVGGETMVQAAARDRLEDEIAVMALIALPLVAVALVLAFGARRAFAPLLASATGAVGAVALLGLLAEAIDLGAAGLAAAAAVGLAVGTEVCAVLRRGFLGEAGPSLEERIAGVIERTAPSVAVAAGGAALASLATIAIALPSARSAAVGGALAALLAAASALVAMPSAIVLAPPAPGRDGRRTEARAGPVSARLRGLVAKRPWLAWIPAFVVAAALVIAGAHAFDPEASTDLAADVPASSEAGRAGALVAQAASEGDAGELLAAPEGAGPAAREALASGLPWAAGLLTLLGLLTAYAATGSRRAAFARGIATALPALAVLGILTLAGKDDPPLGIDLGRLAEPQVSALLVVLAAVGAVSTARAGIGDALTALPGTVVAGAALAVLVTSDLTGVAQAGVAVAAGLLVDLALVRAVLVPALDRALPAGAPRVRVPLPGRFRR